MFVVRVVRSQGRDVTDVEFPVAGESALVGRDAECAVPLPDDKSVSRRHARIEWIGDGRVRVIDLDSVNGVWVDERRIADERLRDRAAVSRRRQHPRVRVGIAGRGNRLRSDTSAAHACRVGGESAGSQRLTDAGEPFAVGERAATLLDDPACAYYVSAGRLDVFTVTIEDGRALEGRSHFVTVPAGGVVFGMDPRQSHGTLLVGDRHGRHDGAADHGGRARGARAAAGRGSGNRGVGGSLADVGVVHT